MTDLELLFLVLGIIYVWECGWWAKQGSVGFRNWVGSRWTVVKPSRVLGTQRAGLVLAAPVPPLGTLFTTHIFPAFISPVGVVSVVSPVTGPASTGTPDGQFALFADIKQIDARAKTVRLNGQPFLKAPSAALATNLVRLLKQVRLAKPEDRTKLIERELSRAYEPKAAEQRYEEFNKSIAGLRFSANLLFCYLFVLAPWMLWRVGLVRGWPWLLAALLVCTATIAFQYHSAHKKLYPDAEDERFTHFIILLLSPASAVRALDLLTRPLLESYHPLTIGKLFCSESQFKNLATEFLREITYPGWGNGAKDGAAADSTKTFSRELNKRVLESFLRRAGLEPGQLLRPPTATDPSCRSFCPRCLAQFVKDTGQCSDCGAVDLIPFAASAETAAPVSPSRQPSRH